MLATISVSYGQVNAYAFSQSNGTYTSITGGTILGNTAVDDQLFVDPAVPLGGVTFTGVGFPIGFNFTYNGFIYDRFAVNANGWISFGSSTLTPSVNLNTSSSYTPLSSTSTANTNDLVARFAALGRDLQSQVGGEIRYELTGTSPNQVLVIQWTNYRKYLATGDSYNFQIKLYETTNVIESVYGTMTSNATATTIHAGLRANPTATASNFNSRTTTTNWSTSTASVAAGNSMALSATIFPSSGLTFTWTPPALPVSPPNCAANPLSTPNATCGNFTSIIAWDAAATATGYNLTVGTTSNGTDIVNNVNVGNVLTYALTAQTPGTTYFWKVVPFNTVGPAIGCTENSYTTFATGCYCTSVPTSNDNLGVTNVLLNTTNFPNGDVTYFDHTATVVNFAQGLPANTQISFATGYTYKADIWIDFNNDFDFNDSGELVQTGILSTATNPTVLDATFIMPVSAPLGQHRMRIGTADDVQTPPDPCYSGAWGVTLDFTVNIVTAPTDLPDYVNLQFPSTITIAQGGSETVYGQVYEGGLTDVDPNIVGQAPGINAWVGISPIGSNTNPNTWTNWIPATWNSGAVGSNDEYQATIGATLAPGTYYYATRFQLNGGAYVYGGTNFGFWDGTTRLSGVLTVNPPPAPANDDCSGAISLTVNADYSCGTVTPGTILAATASPTDAAACFGTEDDDVWFSFVATATSQRISLLNVAGSTTDLYHSLWTGADCNSITLVPNSCSDPNISNPTGLVIGQIYYVRVYSWTATTGQTSTFNICIGTPPAPPANDNFVNAISVSCGTVYTGDTSVATLDEDNAPDGFGADMDSPNLWYSFTGTGLAQTVTLNLCGSSFDTSVLVYTGSSGSLTLVAGNDDDNTCLSNTGNSKVIFTSNGTTTYYIAVEGWNIGNVGAFTMNVSCAAVVPPAVANQDCGTSLPILVNGLNNNSDNSFGTVNSAQPGCDLFGSIQDVWFSFVVPSSGQVTTQITPLTMTSTNFTIYSGACGALTEVAGTCNSNFVVATSESLTGLTPGATYFVQVWSNSSEQGTFTIRISDDGLGNDGFDAFNFSFYPNPVKNSLNLTYNQEISNVEVFNLLGQKVSSNTINANTAQIDMSNLSKGAYMVRVTSNNQVKTIKIIKE